MKNIIKASALAMGLMLTTPLSAIGYLCPTDDNGNYVVSDSDDTHSESTLRACLDVASKNFGGNIIFSKNMTINLTRDMSFGLSVSTTNDFNLSVDGKNHIVSIDAASHYKVFDFIHSDIGKVNLSFKHLDIKNANNGIGYQTKSTVFTLDELKNLSLIVDDVNVRNTSTSVGGSVLHINNDNVDNAVYDINITNSTFQDNSALDGGLIYVNIDSSLTNVKVNMNMDKLRAFRNTTPHKAAVCYVSLNNSNNQSNININNSVFSRNTGEYGVLYLKNINADVKTSNLSDNQSNSHNGGIFAENVKLNIDAVIFSSNNSSGAGALYVVEGDTTIVNSTFQLNETTGKGAGIYVDYGEIDINSTTFSGNTANSYGGAIYARQSDVNIYNVKFISNIAKQGAIYSLSSNIKVNNSTFKKNKATSYGGGFLANISDVTIYNSTFKENEGARYGGAFLPIKGKSNIINTTFSLNVATEGGAILNANNNMQIDSSTFSENSSLAGGAIEDYGYINNSSYNEITKVKNSIFYNNTASYYSNTTPIYSNGNNIFSSDTNVTNGVKSTDIVGVDPQLEDIKNNGGYTETYALAKDSVAIDAGSTAVVHDQRGFSRLYKADIGAYEFVEGTSVSTSTQATNSNGNVIHLTSEQVGIINKSTYENTPRDVKSGYDIKVKSNTSAFTYTITFKQPAGSKEVFTGYSKFGPLTKGGKPQWYKFDNYYVANSGVGYRLLNGGKVMEVVLKDGAKGDDDFTVNKTIIDPGFPSVKPYVEEEPQVSFQSVVETKTVPLPLGASALMGLLFASLALLGFRRKENFKA